MTQELELTEPVDLCTPDGTALNPAARGWSRRPLHRANLHGCWGRNKRWDYWAVLAGDLVVSCVYSDIDHIGLADVYWADLVSGQSGGHGIIVEAGVMSLPEQPATEPLTVDRDGLVLELDDDADGTTHLRAAWTEPDGRPGRFDIAVALPDGHESLNVVIPWSDDTFNFTSKHWARPATGELVVGDRRWEIGGGPAPDAWGVLDVGRGRWPHEIAWNWGGGAGRCDGHVIGLQVGGKWTEDTGHTENGLIVDGRLTKLGRELTWDYDWDHPMQPWRVEDPGGQLHAELTPRFDKHTHVGDDELGSETHQVFGAWSGRLTTDDGRELEFEGLQGFAEEARQRW
ncbi:MAG: DUF2804 domain-containing protein [Acidimicrobiales bacterium]